jgi:hypothetical protein
MCLLCAPSGNRGLARRDQILQLLALVEHPDALPADAALRLAQEILALTQTVTQAGSPPAFQCEPVLPPQAAAACTDDGKDP